MKGLIHETPDTTTFKCYIHKSDTLIQEDISDASLKIRSLRFRQLSHPPPNLFQITPSSTNPSSLALLYGSVWKVELSCPLDVRWVFHCVLPALPKLTFLRFGTGCFEEFHYDYDNSEVNQYYVQLLALNYTSSKNPSYPDVRELHVSFDERKLSDFSYPIPALVASINTILDCSIKYLTNSLSKTNLTLPSNCAIDSFLHAFPKLRTRGEKFENYERNVVRFVTAGAGADAAKAPGIVRTPSIEHDRLSNSSWSPTTTPSDPRITNAAGVRPSAGAKRKYIEPPATPFYADPTEISDKRNHIEDHHHPIFDVPSSDSDDEPLQDPRTAPKLRIVDKAKVLATPEAESDEDQVCSSTTPTPVMIEPPPRPPPMGKKWVNDIISSIANAEADDSDSNSSDSERIMPGDETEPVPIQIGRAHV